MKKSKFMKALLALGLGAVSSMTVIGFTACDKKGDDGKHTHNYVWVDDENDTTHHEHCDVDGCDVPDKAAEEHTWSGDECSKCHAAKPSGVVTESAIIPEYKGEAAGPEAGEKQIVSRFLANDIANDTLEEEYSNGIVTIPKGTAFRNRDAEDANGNKISPYQRSVWSGTITITLPTTGNLKIYYSSGSGKAGDASYTLKKPGVASETNAINTTAKVLQCIEIDNAAAGTYEFSKAAGTVDTYEIVFTYNVVGTPIKELTVMNAGTVDYLVTQKVDCTGVELLSKDESGATYPVSLENCTFDTSDYNPNASGEYSIDVTYHLSDNLDSATKEFTATYKVKVYTVDSIELSTIGLASNKQVTVQQAFLQGGVFNDDNLAVVATCSLGNATIKKTLKKSWCSVTTPSLTAEGTKEVTVSVNSKYTTGNQNVSATYEVAVKAKKDVTANKVEITVGETGDFKTLTQAVQYLKVCNYAAGVDKVIKLQAGTYTEKVWLDIDNVTLIGLGTNIDDTKLTYSLVEGDADALNGTLWALNCATLHVTGKNFKAYNLAIRNDFNYIANSGKYSGTQAAQGVALTLDADGAVIYKCHLYGNQDTLYMKSGRSYYYKTQIDGNIDFIFGGEDGLAYFDDCKIVAICKSATAGDQNGYVTAAKHSSSKKPNYGYIFANCELTDDGKVKEGSMSLGRPWGEKATVAYINCTIGKAYSKLASTAGGKNHRWYDWSATQKAASADFCEYGSTGAGAITAAVEGGKVITDASGYTKANIFGTSNGKVGYTTVFDCDTEFANLKTLAGLE